VIVTASNEASAQALVLSVLGKVVTALPTVNGVVADISPLALPLLSGVLGVAGVTITPDLPVVVGGPGSSAVRAPSAVFPQATGASQLVASGTDGRGINVAVIDTGIDNLPDFSGRLVGGVDLSGKSNPFRDTYGHGTFVAGLVAGNGASSNGQYLG
jgi:serine protease AprX